MNIKRKIKKEIKSIPTVSFEEFCAKNNIEFPEKPLQSAKKHRYLRRWIFAPAALVVAIIIVLPIVLSMVLGGGEMPPTELPPIIDEIVSYGENDVEKVTVTTDYFNDKAGTILIDLNKISNEPLILKEVPVENSSIDVSYIFKDAMVPFLIDAKPFALYITYRIKVYEHYTFIEEKYYDNLENEFTIHSKAISYQLNITKATKEAYVYFEHNENEYYIHVKEVMPQWGLTEASLKALMQYLLD